jgi:altronate hydrolase
MQLIAITRTGEPAVIRLNSLDNVLIARQALPEGLSLEAEAITVIELITEQQA